MREGGSAGERKRGREGEWEGWGVGGREREGGRGREEDGGKEEVQGRKRGNGVQGFIQKYF